MKALIRDYLETVPNPFTFALIGTIASIRLPISLIAYVVGI